VLLVSGKCHGRVRDRSDTSACSSEEEPRDDVVAGIRPESIASSSRAVSIESTFALAHLSLCRSPPSLPFAFHLDPDDPEP